MRKGCSVDRFWYERKGIYDKLFYTTQSVMVVAEEEIRRCTLPSSRYTSKPDMEIRWMR